MDIFHFYVLRMFQLDPKGFLLKSPLAQGDPGPERPRSIASGGKADEATTVTRSQFGVGILSSPS